MQSHNLLFGTLTNNLERCWVLPYLGRGMQVVEHGRKLRMVGLDIFFPVLVYCLWLSESYGADLWVSKDNSWDKVIG